MATSPDSNPREEAGNWKAPVSSCISNAVNWQSGCFLSSIRLRCTFLSLFLSFQPLQLSQCQRVKPSLVCLLSELSLLWVFSWICSVLRGHTSQISDKVPWICQVYHRADLINRAAWIINSFFIGQLKTQIQITVIIAKVIVYGTVALDEMPPSFLPMLQLICALLPCGITTWPSVDLHVIS